MAQWLGVLAAHSANQSLGPAAEDATHSSSLCGYLQVCVHTHGNTHSHK